jgi:hypothetical protein
MKVNGKDDIPYIMENEKMFEVQLESGPEK